MYINEQDAELSRLFNLIKEPVYNAKQHLMKISSSEREFSRLRESFVDTLSKKLIEAEEQEQYLKENLVQDHLVIAFFGETNAGKSTIIDTFRIIFNENTRKESIIKADGKGTDGLIVGDGRHDFTKSYNEYDMMIDGKKFTLIDVPGIEGNEMHFKEGIKKALQKAHCIFYVHGSSTKPNIKTTEKIKEYLNDWVSVYSICNIRGGSEDYEDDEDRNSLFTDKVLESTELTKGVLEKTLQKHYLGNITVQGLLALCSKANFNVSKKELIGAQEDLIDYFKDYETIYQFSHFQDIIETVREMSIKYKDIIRHSNNEKVCALAKHVLEDVNFCITQKKDSIRNYYSKLSEFDKNVSNDVSKAKSKLSIRDIVEDEFNKFRIRMYKAIDNNEEEVKSEAKAGVKSLERNIKKLVEQRLFDTNYWLNDKIQRHKRNLESVFSLTNTSINIKNNDIEFDTSSITDEMKDFDFGSSISAALAAASLSFIIPVIGWITGTLITIATALFGGLFGNDGKAKAKRKLDLKINDAIEEVIKKLNEGPISTYKDNLMKIQHLTHNKIQKEKDNINRLQVEIEDLKEDMKLTIIYTK